MNDRGEDNGQKVLKENVKSCRPRAKSYSVIWQLFTQLQYTSPHRLSDIFKGGKEKKLKKGDLTERPREKKTL